MEHILYSEDKDSLFILHNGTKPHGIIFQQMVTTGLMTLNRGPLTYPAMTTQVGGLARSLTITATLTPWRLVKLNKR